MDDQASAPTEAGEDSGAAALKLHSVSLPAAESSQSASPKRSKTPPLKLDTSSRVTLGMFPGTVPFSEPQRQGDTEAGNGNGDCDSIASTGSLNTSHSVRQQYALTSTCIPSPGAISLAEFKQRDSRPRHQRMILYHISLSMSREATIPPPLTAKQKRDTLKKQHSSQKKSVSSAFSMINNLLKSKKKRRPINSVFHLLFLAIHDHRTHASCQLVEELSASAIRKKQPVETGACFLHAAANGMENICLMIYERGFPANVNDPILPPKTLLPISDGGNRQDFMFPSYFILLISLGLENISRAMIKRASVNQSWYGLTPLYLACSKGNLGMVKLMVEYGANVFKGLPLECYYLFLNLKSDFAQAVTEAAQSIPRYRAQWRPETAYKNGKPGTAAAAAAAAALNVSLPAGDSLDHSPASDSLDRSPARTDAPRSSNRAAAAAIANGKGNAKIYEEFVKGRSISPVEIASMSGHFDCVKYLLSKYDTSQAARLSSCFHPHLNLDTACAFLRAGALPQNCLDPWGSNALHLAARAGNLALVVAYITLGKLDVDSRGRNGWTALHEATSTHSMTVARYLVRSGCDTSITNDNGETALMLAERVGIPEADISSYFEKGTDASSEESEILARIKSAASGEKVSDLSSQANSKRRKAGGDASSVGSNTPESGGGGAVGNGKVRSTSEPGFLRGLMGKRS